MPVPFARDLSRFDPVSCRRPDGYQVGPKGAERWFVNYDDALRYLFTLAVPRWRRPSRTSGRFGIVTGIGVAP